MYNLKNSIKNQFLKYRRLLMHTGFWLFYVLFFGSVYGKYGNNFSWYFLESFCMLPFVMLATYTTIYFILPFYLKKRNLILAVGFVILLLFLTTLGERISLRLLNRLPVSGESLFGVTFLYLMLETNFMVGIAFVIKMVKKWLVQQKEKHEMEKRNLQTELNQLKAQLHPHFLFNTMNNLYAMSVGESAKTSESIARFSELLRSVLYECNETEVDLDKEISLICNYIDLEKIRYGDRLKIGFEITGETAGIKIAPMLLFTFVENSFKHGAGFDPGNPSIQILIQTGVNELTFSVENSKPLVAVKEINQGGIGLKNVQKRLDLIYGKNYSLKIDDESQKFGVVLKISQPNEPLFIQ